MKMMSRLLLMLCIGFSSFSVAAAEITPINIRMQKDKMAVQNMTYPHHPALH
ncbi:hypothetical protein [Holospora curviuscula]|uniref:Uncharacterized protein n=1 Tax=Holospora curviuscula TaxID=1082868 RepID=A0A2S5R6X8_9PROT|nr:hypothetical protein [Holospora curviuscula]PPE03043.1 hypothetical protein HCUR_01474 [Holospora curviuscula]